ncbi:MAG: hypothetical protein JWN18_212 [Parcubacteria group bacterium]|nr:hypothetical protein [Parcubacteria group bacterium]
MHTPYLSRFVAWTARVFNIDTQYLLQGTFWSSLAQIVITLSALSLSIILSRHLPKEVYGQYKYVLSLISLLSMFSLSSVGTAVLQSTSRGYEGALQEGFRSNLRWSLPMVLGALGLGSYYLLQGNVALGVSVLIGGTFAPFISSASIASSFLIAKKDFEGLAFYGSILSTFIPASALMLTALLTKNFIILVAVYFFFTAGSYLFTYFYALKKHHPDPTNVDAGMMSYAKHLSVIGVLGGLAANIDQVLLYHFVGPIELALYNFAIGIPDQSKGPLKNIDSMLQARFANHLPANIRTNMRTKALLLLAFGAICASAYILCAPYIYLLLFPAYIEAVPYSQVYALTFLTFPFIPSLSYLSAKRLIKEQYINNFVSSTLRITFIAIGVIYAGLWGLVWAILAARLSNGIVGYILYRIASARESAGAIQ